MPKIFRIEKKYIFSEKKCIFNFSKKSYSLKKIGKFNFLIKIFFPQNVLKCIRIFFHQKWSRNNISFIFFQFVLLRGLRSQALDASGLKIKSTISPAFLVNVSESGPISEFSTKLFLCPDFDETFLDVIFHDSKSFRTFYPFWIFFWHFPWVKNLWVQSFS